MKRRGSNIRKWIMRHFVVPVARCLPLDRAHLLIEKIGHFEFELNPHYRRYVFSLINEANSRLGLNWPLVETSRLVAGRLTRWRVRDLLLDGENSARVLDSFSVDGLDNLQSAIAEGHGVVLLSNHFGAHIQVANWMYRQGIEFRFLTERPRHLSKVIDKYFRSEGPLGQRELFLSRHKSGNAATAAIVRALKCLKAGHVVLTTNDVRWNDNRSVVARLMGIDWRFTSTWVMLAQRSKAPIVQVFCLMLPDGRHELRFLPPEHIPADADPAEWIQKTLDRLQAMINLEPGNSCEFLSWPFDRSAEGLSVRVSPVDEVTSVDRSIPSPHFGIAAKANAEESGKITKSH